MTVVDWRDVSADVVGSLLLAERDRELRQIDWDLTGRFTAVEAARQHGEMPGLVLMDRHGEASGWAFFVLARGVLQIGGLHAPSAGGVRRLLQAVLQSPEAGMAQGVSCFLRATSPSLTSALLRLGFDLRRYDYLDMPLSGSYLPAAPAERPLTMGDAPQLVRLLARGYAGEPAARALVPTGRMDEWAGYVGQLLKGPAAGLWRPDLSQARWAPDGTLVAALVVTEVADRVAHVAQLVVDPAHRRGGAARTLLAAGGAAAAAHGVARLTLMVSETNDAALSLYRSVGFAPRAGFVHGLRGPVPRTVNGVTIRASRLGAVA